MIDQEDQLFEEDKKDDKREK